jgi:hypothetical protein
MKHIIGCSTIALAVSLISLPVVINASGYYRMGDREYDEHDPYALLTEKNSSYNEVCGSCHMAYPPALLPTASWNGIMTRLEDHYGDNAELDIDTYKVVYQFLANNSADKRTNRSNHFKTSNGDTLMRITDSRYFMNEHSEIPSRMVTGNPKVNSFSNCNTCHAKAEQGDFNEHNVNIPGYGPWDD